MFRRKFVPAISIVIPMYNAEKYIGECLDSILAQTFQNFELIIVDDCSTDKSCEIVESYIPKFNVGGRDRIRLIHNKKNSGSGAAPRNIGIKFAIGEYIFPMDNDDAITETALEELYTAAKNFQADVVQCQKSYTISGEVNANDKKFWKESSSANGPTDNLKFLSNNLADRVKIFTAGKLPLSPHSHFIKRDLIFKSDIKFPPLTFSDDFVFSFYLLCLSEKYLLYTFPVYIYRERGNSIFHKSRTLEEIIHERAGDFFVGMKYLDEFMSKSEFFNQQPGYKYLIYNFFALNCGLESNILQAYRNYLVPEIDSLLRKELEKVGDTTALTAYLFSRASVFTKELVEKQKIIDRLKAQK